MWKPLYELFNELLEGDGLGGEFEPLLDHGEEQNRSHAPVELQDLALGQTCPLELTMI